MAELPSLEHLSKIDYEHVYEPAADTYLMIDALKYEVEKNRILSDVDDGVTALEIGCGTAVSSVFLNKCWKGNRRACAIISMVTDINPHALRVAQETALENEVSLDCIRCDIVSAIQNEVDLVLFNPPYVPTPSHEVKSTGIEASWAGGIDGREVVDRAVLPIARILSKPHGVGYIVTVDDNRPMELAERFQKQGLEMKPLFRRRARNESLTIQKLTWHRPATCQ